MTEASAPRAVPTLSRELSEFLIEFAIVLNKHAIYPAGHPLLDASRAIFANRLSALLVQRETISLGVAQKQLVIEGIATESGNALLRELARRLHRQQLAAVRISRGVTQSELTAFLRTLATDSGTEAPLGLRHESNRTWEHIRLFAITFGGLELDKEVGEAGTGRAALLWIELARATMPEDTSGQVPDPSSVASAISRRDRDVAYDQVVIGYLLQLSDELKRTDKSESAEVRHRVSALVKALDPQALQRLLEMGGERAQRLKLVRGATDTLAVEAVIELLGAAAITTRRSISHGMVLMLGKLGKHATEGGERSRVDADVALREHVKRLLDDWELDDPNPQAYSAVLERIAYKMPSYVPTQTGDGVTPQHIIEMAIEVGEAGRWVLDAADDMLKAGESGLLMGILARAPDGSAAADAIWQRVTRPERLLEELDRPKLDGNVVETMIARMGMAACDPLLTALGTAQDRARRWSILRLLTALGTGIVPQLVERLGAAPWYLQRNVLVLLGRLDHWPDGFSLVPYAHHEDARVRREALKAMMASQALRADGIRAGLRDADEANLLLAMNAALESCPAEALPLAQRILDVPQGSPALRTLSIRIVANV